MQGLFDAIEALMTYTSPMVAIDGPCGSGKTTLAENLLLKYPGALVFHLDDFFLQPADKTVQRLSLPGGNIDHERFLTQVLLILARGGEFTYDVYHCQSNSFTQKQAGPAPLYIIEGVYSLHRNLRDYYDIKVFLEIDEQLQKERILQRSPRLAERFFKEWIPLENLYFDLCGVRECSDFHLEQF